MQLQKISINPYSRKKDLKDVAFKNRLTFDIGASDPRGSLKILVQDNNGRDMFEYKGFVNDTTGGFKDNQDFIKKIAAAADVETLLTKDIETIEGQMERNHLKPDEKEKLQEKLSILKNDRDMLKKQTPEEKKITGFALLLPGTIQGKIALFMANLRKTDGTSLTDVNLEDVVQQIADDNNIGIADDVQFIPCKDLAGTGLGVTKKLINHPVYGQRFSEGFYAAIVQTGGGFGAMDVKVKDNSSVDIETDECGHDMYYDENTNKEIRLGAMGASAGCVITNYANKMGIFDEDRIKALKDTGLAQLATQSEIKLSNKKDGAAIEVLTKTGRYEIIDEKSESTTLRVKDSYLQRFKEASSFAINAYAYALSRHAISKINRGVNLYVVSGPLALGLDSTIKNDPENYGAEGMADLITKFIDKRVKNDNTCARLRQHHGFEVVCDKSLSVDNNTSGGALLLSGSVNTFRRRGEWMGVPINSLKNS